jgi:hypothetical protein
MMMMVVSILMRMAPESPYYNHQHGPSQHLQKLKLYHCGPPQQMSLLLWILLLLLVMVPS